MRTGWLVLTVLLSALPMACGEDPCDAYSGGEVCAKIKTAMEAKCGSFDCKSFVEPGCNTTQKFCKAEIDKCIADINAAADCNATATVTCTLSCFD